MSAVSAPRPDLISIIIPVHNRAAMLREAVRSVLEQTYRPIEVVIVDDGSTDDTPEVAQALAGQKPGVVRVLRQPNAGPGPARQAGLEASRGELIQFLDSDDLLLPHKFAVQVAGLAADPEAGISYGLTLLRDERTGQTAPTHGTDARRRELLPAIVQGRIWATPTPLYRRSVCVAIGPWASLRVLEDWDYDWRAALLGVKLHYHPEPLAVVRHHGRDHAGLAWLDRGDAARQRVLALERMLRYAEQAGVPAQSAEMQQFARNLFLVARQYGAGGLAEESRQLFALARRASGEVRGAGLDFRLYRLAASVLGWSQVGRLSCWLDRMRA